MHSLLSQYALTFNRRYDHIGHLYQDRFESRMIEDERYGSAVIGFIHSIPVRSGLAASSLDWPWSSAREYAGLTETGLLKIAKSPTDASFEPQLEEDRRFLRDPEKTLDAIFQSELGQIALLNAQSARAKFVGRAISAGYHRGEIAKYLGCSLSTVFRLSRNRSK